MKYQNNKVVALSKAFLSFFGAGYFPKAPGTFGSIATIPLILFLSFINITLFQLISLCIVLIIIASLLAEYIQQLEQTHDPQWIVMDEVIGMLVTWAFVFPSSDWESLTAVLVIFRIFDIIKIWPASYFDKKIKHGLGTIVDDVVSGVMAGFVLLGVKNFF